MTFKEDLSKIVEDIKRRDLRQAGADAIELLLNVGINGEGPFKSAQAVADEFYNSARDREEAIRRAIKAHRRLVTAAGFASGLGGLPAMPVTVPADISVFYLQATRLVAVIAILRGYDPQSEEVRSVIAISLIGMLGTETLGKIGITVTGKISLSTLKRLPGSILIKINQAVGFRLVTKFGAKGVVNLVKVIPVFSGGVSGGINAYGMTAIAGYAKHNFPPLEYADSTASV